MICAAAGNYDSLACSQLVVFQILTTSNWQVLNTNITMETHTKWSALFLITWYGSGLRGVCC